MPGMNTRPLIAILSCFPVFTPLVLEAGIKQDILDAENFAEQQTRHTMSLRAPTEEDAYPRNTATAGDVWSSWGNASSSNWMAGFFPGVIWNMYEKTGDPLFRDHVQILTDRVEGTKTSTNKHDIGFILLNTFEREYELLGTPTHPDVIKTGGESLSNGHWMDPVGMLWSFDFSSRGVKGFRNVIIDTTMNIELMYMASKYYGDTPNSETLYNRAVSHMQRVATDHVRPDGGTYQVINYRTSDGTDGDGNPYVAGDIENKVVWQGYDVESTWSRGQGWCIHGLTTGYRETGDAAILDGLLKAVAYYQDNVPADYVPYWDFSAPLLTPADLDARYPPKNPDDPPRHDGEPLRRDTSAASITAAGLMELCWLLDDPVDRHELFDYAVKILHSLATNYTAEGTAMESILKEGTYTFPGNRQGLSWGDFYFTEAIERYKDLVMPELQFSADAHTGNRGHYMEMNPNRWQTVHDAGSLRYALRKSHYAARKSNQPGELAMIGGYTYTDPVISVDIKSNEHLSQNAAADAVVVFNYLDGENYNFFLLSSLEGESGFYEVRNGVRSTLQTVGGSMKGISAYDYQTVELTIGQNSLVAELDGSPFLTYTGTSGNTSGFVGLGSLDDAVFFDNVTVSGTPASAASASTLNIWRATHFDGQPFLAENSMDPDKDGRLNLLEFVLGSDPNVPDVQLNAPYIDVSAPSLRARFYHDPSADSAISILQGSDNLATWHDIGTATPVPGQPGWFEAETGSYRFFRQKVVSPLVP